MIIILKYMQKNEVLLFKNDYKILSAIRNIYQQFNPLHPLLLHRSIEVQELYIYLKIIRTFYKKYNVYVHNILLKRNP
jgi:sulfur relay (sulfurtransferase) DsrC/TusE family protein